MNPEEEQTQQIEQKEQISESPKISLEDIGFSVIIIVLLMILAPLFDFIGIILFILSLLGVGIPFSFVLDIIAGAVIGILLYLFNQSTAGIEKGLKGFIQFLSKIAPRFGATLGAELLPFLGDISPSWTILVIVEIIDKIVRR
jgi:hypothetical protein